MSDENRRLKARTKVFALDMIRLYVALPHNDAVQILGKQAVRSGTPVGAHYREACRARSQAEFISKVEGGLQELEETGYWLELLVDSGLMPSEPVAPLLTEADELTAMLVASVKTAKSRP